MSSNGLRGSVYGVTFWGDVTQRIFGCKFSSNAAWIVGSGADTVATHKTPVGRSDKVTSTIR
jgi:hypothetical protein